MSLTLSSLCKVTLDLKVFSPVLAILLIFLPAYNGKEEKKRKKEIEKEVRQGRTDGCFSVAPGLVFNFR